MASEAAVAICLRCDWRGSEPGHDTACPLCAAPLYRPATRRPRAPSSPAPPPGSSAAPATGAGAPAAIIVDPPSTEPADPASPGGRRWWAGLATVAVGVVSAVALMPRGTDAPPAGAEPRERASDVPEATQRVEVPAALSEALDGEASVTFSSMEELPGIRDPLFRLWRLSLPDGRLRPGPVAGPLRALRADPRADADRLALIEADGQLFVLDGFAGARLHRVVGRAEAFDFLPDGTIVAASVSYRTARCCGGTETVIHLGRIRQVSPLRMLWRRWGLRSLTVQGMAVRGTRAYVWGIQEGGYHLVELDVRGRRRVERPLGALRPIGIDPAGRLLVGKGGGIGHLALARSQEEGAVRWGTGIDLREILAWSPDGRIAAYGSWRGRRGVWILEPGRRRPLFGARTVAPPGSAAFLPGGRLVAWTQPGAIAVADTTARAVHRIELPDAFPRVRGPVAGG